MKKLSIFIAAIIMSCALLGCGNANGVKVEKAVTKKYELNQIQYALSKAPQNEDAGAISLNMPPVRTYKTGEEMAITAKITGFIESDKNVAFLYYIADWGDGTWSYNGPFEASANRKSLAELKHVYKKAGTYSIKVAGLPLTSEKTVYGWSAPSDVVITGEAKTETAINNLKAISSSNESGHDAEKMLDNDSSTYFQNKNYEDGTATEWAGLLFDDIYRLKSFEVQFKDDKASFPTNIAVEYTTDYGKTWYSLPKYYYLYDYSINRYAPIMYFPSPMGATLTFALDDIVANGIRFSSKLALYQEKQFAISEMRVIGDKEPLLYTSFGETYDADLNNMQSIYGTAKTEPLVNGSIKGEAVNTSPFRTGTAMIGSTEWLEWNGLKSNWTDYDKFRNAYLETLIDTRYGADGWSDNDGYIWATPDAPQHLDVQNHYTYNSTFIIAARNYLMQGNNVKPLDAYGNPVDFMDLTNKLGQKMSDKIEKAMNYQLGPLEGESGILTINDPRNDGTVNGVASNYWDVFKSFGYKSAYENALFYGSLLAYADIMAYQGNTLEYDRFIALAAKAKTEYNKLFWDNTKGRYITSVNVEGFRADFGMTFVNFKAISYGLADDWQAKLIYEWLDGERIIAGDTSQGADIYGEFKYAARSNTLDISSTGSPYYWWDHNGQLPCTPGTFGGYNHTMQNGGTIFYISHYDVLGRIKKVGADNAIDRFNVIMNEFHKDNLRRNGYMPYTQNGMAGVGEYREGILGEFPESGLVPYTFINGFLGLTVDSKGLRIEPNLPSSMSYAGIREYKFGNRMYSIQVSNKIKTPSVVKEGDKYFVKVPSNKNYCITLDNKLIEL